MSSNKRQVGTSSPKKKAEGKYTPASGRDFDVSLRVADDYRTARTRDNIAYIALAAALLATLSAAVYGFVSNDFSGLKQMWAVTGPIIGLVLGFYFHRGRNS